MVLFSDNAANSKDFRSPTLHKIPLEEVFGAGVVKDELYMLSLKNGVLCTTVPTKSEDKSLLDEESLLNTTVPSFQIEEKEPENEIDMQCEKLLKVFQGKMV
jgi:hypothetical protein